MAWTRLTAYSSRYLLLGCDEIIKRYPNTLEVITYMCFHYSQHQQTDKAIEVISNFINANPRRSVPYYIRSALYLDEKQYDQAKRDYLRGLKFQMRTDKDFKRKYPDELIEKATIDNEEELENILKVTDEALGKQVSKYGDFLEKIMPDPQAKRKRKR
jgi:tetratricopeptide (TPR) repeat protein